MKPIKYIVFADDEAKCSSQDQSFIKKLELDFKQNGDECAIGFSEKEKKKITEWNEGCNIFLFEDPGRGYKPESESCFLKTFVFAFYKEKDNYDFRIILHKGSEWDFESYYYNGKLNANYDIFKVEIQWLKTLPCIKHSYVSDGVYCKELQDMASAGKNNYSNIIEQLKKRFRDPINIFIVQVQKSLGAILAGCQRKEMFSMIQNELERLSANQDKNWVEIKQAWVEFKRNHTNKDPSGKEINAFSKRLNKFYNSNSP